MRSPVLLDRLMGVEQEYAVAHIPPPGLEHPGNRALFLAILRGVSARVATRSAGGLWGWSRERVFTQTGGSLYYESLPQAMEAGLVEAATPECRGPSETLRYARAWDRLLTDAARDASRHAGGRILLRKNGRDAFDHVYGPQENYEVAIAEGADAWCLRAGLAVLAPLALFAGLAHLAVVGGMLALGVVFALVAMVAGTVTAALATLVDAHHDIAPTRWADAAVHVLAGVERLSLAVWFGPLVVAWAGLLRLFAFRPYRRRAMAFLVTRMIFTGAGSLRRDGMFELSEKARSIRRDLRWSFLSSDRGVLEIGHLLKGLLGPMLMRPGHLLALFRTRQRLQLGMSDANLCEVADYLKLATTALVLDMVEHEVLHDAPVLADPVRSAQQVSEHGLHTPVLLTDGRAVSALSIQRYYADRAAAWLARMPTASMEAHAVVARWQAVLEALEHDPEALIGEVDWVTKRALLHAVGTGMSWEARKKVDLRYHDLGEGYHAWLEGAGVITRIVADDEIARAMEHPPEDTPAAVRGALVRDTSPDAPLMVDWRSARVGGRVIRLEDRRPRG